MSKRAAAGLTITLAACLLASGLIWAGLRGRDPSAELAALASRARAEQDPKPKLALIVAILERRQEGELLAEVTPANVALTLGIEPDAIHERPVFPMPFFDADYVPDLRCFEYPIPGEKRELILQFRRETAQLDMWFVEDVKTWDTREPPY
jgi:hypothetical protein